MSSESPSVVAGAVEAPRLDDRPPAQATAGVLRRWAAALYELLLLTALVFIIQFALLPLVTPGHAGSAQTLVVPALPAQVFLFCVEFAVAAGYLCWCWTGGRRTLAQKTWRLRLVTRGGKTLDRRRALLRYFALWIGPLIAVAAYALLQPHGLGKLAAIALAFNFLWALIDGDREFLHDRIAGTRLLPAT